MGTVSLLHPNAVFGPEEENNGLFSVISWFPKVDCIILTPSSFDIYLRGCPLLNRMQFFKEVVFLKPTKRFLLLKI